MDQNLHVKEPRRPWSMREIALLCAIIVLAVGLVLERSARQAGDRDAEHAAAHLAEQNQKTLDERALSDTKFRFQTERSLNEVKSRVVDLENRDRDHREKGIR